MSFHTAEQGVAAVDRALAILGSFTAREPVRTLSEIARATGFYKSTCLRLIASLEHAGYLRRLGDGRYAAGAAALALARAYQCAFHIGEAVMPVLRRVVARAGETASFYVREGNERVCLHRVEPDRIVRVSAQEGDRLPLERGASGRVFLAMAGAPGRAMDEVRRRLCAVSVGERDPETAAVACPVFGAGDALAGALNISGPRVRLTERRQRELKTLLLEEARALSAALGASSRCFETETSPRPRGALEQEA